MKDKAKISFVIPCYDDGQLLRDAIASVEACPRELYDLTIVDDGSTDPATKEILTHLDGEGRRILTQSNKGPAAARNTGIAASASEYILPLDADNKIRPDFVEKAVKILDTRPEISIVHSDFQYFGLYDHVCRIEPFDIRKMLNTNHIDTCALYRRSVWEACGGYDENDDLRGLEDWDFWLNAYTHGARFLHLEMVGFDYAAREGSQLARTKETENWRRAEEYLYSKYAELLRDHYRDYQRWDFHGREFRRRPLRTLFRLFTNAVWPRLHNRIYKIRS